MIIAALVLASTVSGVVTRSPAPPVSPSAIVVSPSPAVKISPMAKATRTASLLVVSSTDLRVVDGDTVEVKGPEKFKLRLRHVDCPESRQPGGPLATEYLRELINTSKSATVSVVSSDMYGRSMGDLILKDGDAAYQLVAYGYCLPYRNGTTLRGARDMAVRLQRGPYWDGRWRGWCGDEIGRVAMKSGGSYCKVRDFTNYNKYNCSKTTGIVSDEVCITPETPAWVYRKSLKEIQAIGKGK